MSVLLYIHLLAATVWVGGLIMMAGLVPAVRSTGVDRAVIQTMARRFGVISWIALTTLVLTGGTMVMISFHFRGVLIVKVSLVAVVTGLTLWHSLVGSSQTPRVRGIIQGVILLLSLVILGLALAI